MNVKLCNNKLVEWRRLGKTSHRQNALVRNMSANNKNNKRRMNFMR
jgi:hypothetical protein